MVLILDKAKLIKKYVSITEVMLSAIKARKFEIFEVELEERKKILETILEKNEEDFDVNSILEIIERLKDVEILIAKEISDYKQEIEVDNNENKKKLNTIKKANSAVNSYRMGTLGSYSSSIIDKRK